MKRNRKERIAAGLAPLLLLSLFAAGVLAVLLSGAAVLRRIRERDDLAYSGRTLAQYVSVRVRQAETPDAVSVEPFGETEALCIREHEEDGRCFVTRIYACDGWLRELYAAEEARPEPEDGEKLLETDAFRPALRDGFLTAELGGSAPPLLLWLRGGEDGR